IRTESLRAESRWPSNNVRRYWRAGDRPRCGRSRSASSSHARRSILHGCVDSLSTDTVDAWQDRCDQEEYRQLNLFHKSLRQLNIANTSWLQASLKTITRQASRIYAERLQ